MSATDLALGVTSAGWGTGLSGCYWDCYRGRHMHVLLGQ